MNWELFIQCFNLAFGLLLLIRLFSVRLHKVYKWFFGFLVADLSGSAAWIIYLYSYRRFIAVASSFYWIAWLIITPLVWVFTLATIYFLLGKVLIQLPGLLRLSKRVLHLVFLAALIIGIVSARYEYSAPGFRQFKIFALFLQKPFLLRCWIFELVFDRVIASVALLSLVAIMTFLLWFPIAIPRNLVILSIGFTVYFASMTVLLLLRSFWPDETIQKAQEMVRIVRFLMSAVSGACFAFWSMYLSPAGETVAASIAIQRSPKEQEQLISQLELINEALVKSIHR